MGFVRGSFDFSEVSDDFFEGSDDDDAANRRAAALRFASSSRSAFAIAARGTNATTTPRLFATSVAVRGAPPSKLSSPTHAPAPCRTFREVDSPRDAPAASALAAASAAAASAETTSRTHAGAGGFARLIPPIDGSPRC